jgi:putative ubiquitin-RnfH superfamily antitoxin RatB of RatAB toxin-antitoxin module
MRVELVYCPAPHACDRVELELAEGATLTEALRASGLAERHGLAAETLDAGIWGRVQPPQTVLRDGDRVELYRPLTVDPKEARRQRYRRGPAR